MATDSGLMVIKDGKPDTLVVAADELVSAAMQAAADGVDVIGVAVSGKVYTIDRTGYVERYVQCFDAKKNKIDDLGYWVGAKLPDLVEMCVAHAKAPALVPAADSDAG